MGYLDLIIFVLARLPRLPSPIEWYWLYNLGNPGSDNIVSNTCDLEMEQMLSSDWFFIAFILFVYRESNNPKFQQLQAVTQ